MECCVWYAINERVTSTALCRPLAPRPPQRLPSISLSCSRCKPNCRMQGVRRRRIIDSGSDTSYFVATQGADSGPEPGLTRRSPQEAIDDLCKVRASPARSPGPLMKPMASRRSHPPCLRLQPMPRASGTSDVYAKTPGSCRHRARSRGASLTSARAPSRRPRSLMSGPASSTAGRWRSSRPACMATSSAKWKGHARPCLRPRVPADGMTQAYLHELIMWRCLRHPNIIMCIGSSKQFPASLVSEWRPGGTLCAFLREHPNHNRLNLVR
jgi:hypothetical protein